MSCIFWMGHVMTKLYMKNIEEVIYMHMVFQLTSWSLNSMTFDLGWFLKVKLGTMKVILSNIWINFTFGKLFTWTGTNNDNIWLPIGYTSDSEQCLNRLQLDPISLLVNFSHELAHMTSYWLNKRFWAMFEPTPTWPNFAFGQLFTCIGIYNHHIWLPIC